MFDKVLMGAAAPKETLIDWDLSNATYNGTPINFFKVASQETTPQGIFFKNDGTKMYVIGSSGDDVNEYNLSTAWDVSTASYSQNFSVSSQELIPQGIFFKNDGTKMYIIGAIGDDVNEYNLSTAWDISTASYSQNFSVASQETAPQGIFFKDDGTKMYVIGAVGDDVNEYNLSTAWNISTASYNQNFYVGSQDQAPLGIFFKDDGTKMYVIGNSGNDVNEYNLSTAWDISTASYSQNFSVALQDLTPTGISFKDDGTRMYVIGRDKDAVYQYSLSTAWDISTASYSNPSTDYFYVGTEEVDPLGIFFKDDGTKMYIIGFSGDDVNEYNLSTAWDISTASYSQSFSVVSQETSPSGIFFKDDGTKMYVIGNSDAVHQYSLSTAWDVSTASYNQNFSVASQETTPQAIFFKNDGTKMYVIGTSGDDVNEYNLSTAWDVSTASYSQNFYVGSQETGPQGIFFKDSGTQMYVTGLVGDNVNEYNLSTAWDISTASYSQSFSVASQETYPSGIFFKYDGTKMYIIGNGGDEVWSYDL